MSYNYMGTARVELINECWLVVPGMRSSLLEFRLETAALIEFLVKKALLVRGDTLTDLFLKAAGGIIRYYGAFKLYATLTVTFWFRD